MLGAIGEVLEWGWVEAQLLKLVIREIVETGAQVQVFPHFRDIHQCRGLEILWRMIMERICTAWEGEFGSENGKELGEIWVED